jgi:hypothetical protein
VGFSNIDAPGPMNRRDRRAVAAIQRRHGAEARLAAAKEKRMRKAAKQFENDLKRTIHFYAQPDRGFVAAEDPDGAYLMEIKMGGMRQVVVAGDLKASPEHYAKAIGVFLKAEASLVSAEEMQTPPHVARKFTSIIVEVV